MFELNNKVAIVTGASSGIGHYAAIAYAKAGANVAVLARRKEKLDDLVKEIESFGGKSLAVQCDVTKEASVKDAVSTVINEFKTVDILLNNAGVAVGGGVDTLSEEDWDLSINTNLKGVYLMCKYIIPYMKNNHYGKIINISSENAYFADKSDAFIRHSYNASKAGVIGLTIGMAASYAKLGITVNAICPGLFKSEMTATKLFESKEVMNLYNTLCPMSRPGSEGELNGTILYFSSDASSYVTGQHIFVDGGLSII